MSPPPTPHFEHEHRLWASGTPTVIGLDEVGRGALAGPVVVAAVSFAPFTSPTELLFLNEVRDSKQLSDKKRPHLANLIRQHAQMWAIGSISAKIVDTVGISLATQEAANQALSRFSLTHPHQLLSDQGLLPPSRQNQSITHGDQISLSIAAASIVAKVWRDTYMKTLGHNWQYHVYNWSKNKGYGTNNHYDIIRLYGITPHHRQTFCHNHLPE